MNLNDLGIQLYGDGDADFLKIYPQGTRYAFSTILEDIQDMLEEYENFKDYCIIEDGFNPNTKTYRISGFDGDFDSLTEIAAYMSDISLHITVYCSGKNVKSESHGTYVSSIEEILEHMISYPVDFTYNNRGGGRDLTEDEIKVIDNFYKYTIDCHRIKRIKKG